MTYDNSNPPTIGLHLHCMIFHPSCDAQINGVDPSSKNLKKIRTIKVGYKYIWNQFVKMVFKVIFILEVWYIMIITSIVW